ncbi:hypothetical protein HDU79_002559 [Rhizoclosmatium sp. JEL0117]|nr:hypothetical protein HDU79_002559 [Rhizoclosmatium sp. JEL0117]
MKVKPLNHGDSVEIGFLWSTKCVNPIRAIASTCQFCVELVFSPDGRVKEVIFCIDLVPLIKSDAFLKIPGGSRLGVLTGEDIVPPHQYISKATISIALGGQAHPSLAETVAVTVQYNMNATYSELAVQLPSTDAFYDRRLRKAVSMDFSTVPPGANMVEKLVTTALQSLHPDLYNATAIPRKNPRIIVKVDLFYNKQLDVMFVQVDSDKRQTLRLQRVGNILVAGQMLPGELLGIKPFRSFHMVAPVHSPIKPAHFVFSWIKSIQYYYQFDDEQNFIDVWATLLTHLSQFAVDVSEPINNESIALTDGITKFIIASSDIPIMKNFVEFKDAICALSGDQPSTNSSGGALVNRTEGVGQTSDKFGKIFNCIVKGAVLAVPVAQMIRVYFWGPKAAKP